MKPIIDPVIRPMIDQAYWFASNNPSSVPEVIKLLRHDLRSHHKWKSMESLLHIMLGNLSDDAQMITIGLNAAKEELECVIDDQRASCLYRMAIAHLFLGGFDEAAKSTQLRASITALLSCISGNASRWTVAHLRRNHF